MRIAEVTTHPVTFHHDREPLSYCFVRVVADDGSVGWGEACDSFGCTYAGVVAAAIDDAYAPLLVGEDPRAVEHAVARLRGWTRRRLGDQWVAMQALSALECALWDLAGHAAGRPVADLLGRARHAVPVYASSVFLEEGDADFHLALLAPLLERGVRSVKLRVGTDWEPDIAVLGEIRARLGPGVALMIDASEHFTVPTALRLAHALAELGIEWLEEPVPQHHRRGIEEVARRSPVPIAYGEHLFGAHDFAECLERGWAQVLQPDVATCGGIAETRRIAALGARYGARVVPHFAAGPVALAAALHCAASVPNVHLLEYAYPLAEAWAAFAPGAALGPDAVRAGQLAPPPGPGLGVALDPGALSDHPYRPPGPRPGLPTRFVGEA